MGKVGPITGIETAAQTLPPSRRRWPLMIIFMLYGMTTTFQIIQFTIIPDIFATYYQVSMNAVSWTSIINMAVLIALLAPAMWLVESTGLRKVLIIGAGMNAAGTVVKCFAAKPDLFWVGEVFE